MRYYTPFTVVIPYWTATDSRQYMQLRFEQGPSGRFWMDRRLVRKAIKAACKKQLGVVVDNDFINLLLNVGSKWNFRGRLIGSQDNVSATTASEGSSAAKAEE